MREQKIDQLFREKLHSHKVQASEAAWELLAAGLHQKRRKKGSYYAAAAALVLLLSAGWFWLEQRQQAAPLNSDLVAAKQSPEAENSAEVTSVSKSAARVQKPAIIPTDESTIKPGDAAVATTHGHKSAASSGPQPPSSAIAHSSRKKQPKESKPTDDSEGNTAKVSGNEDQLSPASQLANAPAMPAEVIPATIQEIAAPAPIKAAMTSTVAEPIVIRYEVFSAAEKPEPENTSEKVLSVLQKVKQGEISLASIRDAKDNLLSRKFNKP